VAEAPVPDAYVLEVSSFQLDDIRYFQPKTACILNISPDHLDRYAGSMEAYTDAKFRITENQDPGDFLILPLKDAHISTALSKTPSEARTLYFSELKNAKAEACVQDGSLNINFENTNIFIPGEKMPLPGPHNALNTAAALLCALSFGLKPEKALACLEGFEGAAHRLENIRLKNNVRFVNDSKATNVEAVLYALRSFEKNIIWIAGGIDKGNDYSLLMPELYRIKALVALGKENKKLLKFFGQKILIIKDTHSMTEAVEEASKIAAAGDVVLLSPACASFDLFKNYEDRGEQFAESVRIL
jgi:UDP-N-acetylmuramoylalanine--D-glutamate ligase